MNIIAVVWDVDPVFFKIGSLEILYYGLSWAIGLAISTWLFYNFIKREGYSDKMFDSIFWFGVLSTIIGSRLGHCFFYEPAYYLANPLEILNIRGGGMASHGAAIGLLIGLGLWSRKWKMPYIWSLDRISIAVAISGTLVRLGNLMNSEVYGKATTLPWGFIFVNAGETAPMHPTQLYEAICYLAIFFITLWMYYRKDLARRRPGVIFGFFLIALFGSRFFIEFLKQPQVDFERGMSLDMGQLLSVPFILAGIWILWSSLRKEPVKVKPLVKSNDKKVKK